MSDNAAEVFFMSRYISVFYSFPHLGDAANIAIGVMFLVVGLCSFAALKLYEKRKDKK